MGSTPFLTSPNSISSSLCLIILPSTDELKFGGGVLELVPMFQTFNVGASNESSGGAVLHKMIFTSFHGSEVVLMTAAWYSIRIRLWSVSTFII
jgi:hypothetical protein